MIYYFRLNTKSFIKDSLKSYLKLEQLGLAKKKAIELCSVTKLPYIK